MTFNVQSSTNGVQLGRREALVMGEISAGKERPTRPLYM